MPDDSLLGQLADEFIQEVKKGKLPDIETYALKHPELAEQIRELFPTLLLLEGMAATGDSSTEKSPDPSGLSPGNMFGQYWIKREIGRGGMGIVYEASHLLLEKRVALKVLPIRPFMDVERFFREAKTAAGLHHTNIVPVFDVGLVKGIPYYAMQYIEGRNLGSILQIMQSSTKQDTAVESSSDAAFDRDTESQTSSEQKTSSYKQENSTNHFFADPSLRIRTGLPEKLDEYFRWVADMGIQAAEGLAHAHERKVIHRDIKPSNLIIDNKGVLWVTDFGLARRIEDPAVTQSGTLLGTPRYMSPEQAEAAKRPVDQRSDIYSLGATLYELLTCRPVFDGKTPHDIISQITTKEPVAPRRLNAEVPADLSTIVMKAMAKRPEDRFQSASLLAEDLGRWLKMEPIKARRIGPAGRTIRWCRRNPRLATVTAIAAAIILSLSCVFYVGLMRENANTRRALNDTEAALNQAEISEQKAKDSADIAQESQQIAERESENTRAALKREQEARAVADMKNYVANLIAADQYLRAHLITDAEQRLDACSTSLRGWEWEHLNLRLNPASETIRLDSIPTQLTLSSDESKVLWLSEEENEIQAADVRSHELVPLPTSIVKESDGITALPYVVAFSKDGELNARTLRVDGRMWEILALRTRVGRRTIQKNGPYGNINILEIMGTNHRAVISGTLFSRESDVVENLPVLTELSPWGKGLISGIFSPDSALFAAWTLDGEIRIFNTDSGEILCSLPRDSNIPAVAFSPNSDSIAAGRYDGTVVGWRVPSGNQITVHQGHTDFITCLAFRPDRNQIASGSNDNSIRLWDSSSGKLVRSFSNFKGVPESLAFSANGELLVAGTSNGDINIIETESGKGLFSLSGHKASITSAIFDTNSSQIISSSEDKTIRFWDINNLSYVATHEIPEGRVTSAIWNPDGRHIALNISIGKRGQNERLFKPDSRLVAIWDPLTGETISIFRLPIPESGENTFSPDASKIAVVLDTEIQLLNLTPSSKHLMLTGRKARTDRVVFSPNGKIIASAFEDKTITFWDASSGRHLRTVPVPGHENSLRLSFSPNRSRLQSLDYDLLNVLPNVRLQFSPDSSRLLSFGYDKTVRIWDIATLKPFAVLRGHKETVNKASFSPDGSLILSSSFDNTVRVWDSSTGKERFSFTCKNADAIFNQEGNLIYSICSDGTLGIWDVKTGRLLNSSKSNTGSFHSLALSPDQSRLIAGVDKTIKIWDADSLTLLLTIPAHDDIVRSVAFSQDGSMILSVSWDGKAKIWKSKQPN